MKARAPQMVIKPDYRQFRLRKLNTPEFSHIKLLLFWPVFLGWCFWRWSASAPMRPIM